MKYTVFAQALHLSVLPNGILADLLNQLPPPFANENLVFLRHFNQSLEHLICEW